MTKVIMCGHGQLAHSMKESIEIVYGDVNYLLPISFEKLEGRDDLERKMRSLINPQDHVLIVVDLFGGSPFNAASSIALTTPDVEVIAGMSLPLCLELVDNRETLALPELVEHLVDVGMQCVKKLNKTVISETEEDFL